MTTPRSPQPVSVAGYYLGRPAVVWQVALRRLQTRVEKPTPVSASPSPKGICDVYI
jgi:hypothetical protein